MSNCKITRAFILKYILYRKLTHSLASPPTKSVDWLVTTLDAPAPSEKTIFFDETDSAARLAVEPRRSDVSGTDGENSVDAEAHLEFVLKSILLKHKNCVNNFSITYFHVLILGFANQNSTIA